MKLSLIMASSTFALISSAAYANQVTKTQTEQSQKAQATETFTQKKLKAKTKTQIEQFVPPRTLEKMKRQKRIAPRKGGAVRGSAIGVGVPLGQNSIAPRIQNVSRINPLNVLTSSDTVTWRVKFTEAVTNVDAADFSVNHGTLTVSPVSADTYDVTIR